MRRSLSLIVAATLAALAPVAAQTPTAPLRLSFSDAVARATGAAPAVTLAGFQTDQARARVRQTRAALLPDFSATAGWVSQTLNPQAFGFKFPGLQLPRILGPFDLYDGRLHLSQTLFDYAGRSRVRAARTQLVGAEADSAQAIEGAAQLTGLAYLRAVRTDAVVAARTADSALAAELVRLAQAPKDAEVGTQIDVTRAQTQLVASEGALLIARNEQRRTRIDLARSLGLSSDASIELSDTLTAGLVHEDLPDGRDSLVAVALSQRPDLAGGLARGRAAQQAASAISAERMPRVDLAASYGTSGLAPLNGVATRQVALQVTLPILDGFRREGRRAEQDAVVRGSELRNEELRRQIAADVDAARLDLASAGEQQVIATERLRLAQAELDQARERFKAGVATNIEVIDAQVSLVRARDTDIDTRFAAAAARVALARAAGVAHLLH
jgi:outer membrane protein TolC